MLSCRHHTSWPKPGSLKQSTHAQPQAMTRRNRKSSFAQFCQCTDSVSPIRKGKARVKFSTSA
eukprot:3042729-Pleurochrysis_carterae.AAC.5